MGHVCNWTVYRPGQVVINFEIVEVLEVGKFRDLTRYRIRLRCCGAEREATHAWVADNACKGVKRCVACTVEATRSARALKKAGSASAVYACGMLWRSLGQMGFRAGALDGEGAR